MADQNFGEGLERWKLALAKAVALEVIRTQEEMKARERAQEQLQATFPPIDDATNRLAGIKVTGDNRYPHMVKWKDSAESGRVPDHWSASNNWDGSYKQSPYWIAKPDVFCNPVFADQQKAPRLKDGAGDAHIRRVKEEIKAQADRLAKTPAADSPSAPLGRGPLLALAVLIGWLARSVRR